MWGYIYDTIDFYGNYGSKISNLNWNSQGNNPKEGDT